MQKLFICNYFPVHVKNQIFSLNTTWQCCETDSVDISAVENETTMLS